MRKYFGVIIWGSLTILFSLSCTDAEQIPTDESSEYSNDQVDADNPELDTADYALRGDCYYPTGFSAVNIHFAYWFNRRPPSYDAYIGWAKVRADPYGRNGVLIQKRDLCLICGCNPWCVQVWLRLCEK